jgi:predicted PhzF superfamily epimerase YddE/YHI9
MSEPIDVDVVRVFTDESGDYGNELGVIESTGSTLGREQEIAHTLGFSETVFVDGIDDELFTARIRIFTPAKELPFAGHPSVGTAWLIARHGIQLWALREKAGEVMVDFEGDVTWITARADWAPEFHWIPLDSPGEVDALDPADFTEGQHFAYAWIDEHAGELRARMFAPEMGIPEDQATGAAAARITAYLHRDLTILQGEGSVLLTNLVSPELVRVGGRTEFDRRARLELL